MQKRENDNTISFQCDQCAKYLRTNYFLNEQANKLFADLNWQSAVNARLNTHTMIVHFCSLHCKNDYFIAKSEEPKNNQKQNYKQTYSFNYEKWYNDESIDPFEMYKRLKEILEEQAYREHERSYTKHVYKELHTPSWCTALGLTYPTTLTKVREAYRALAIKHHPDKPGGSLEKMQIINAARDEALKVLS